MKEAEIRAVVEQLLREMEGKTAQTVSSDRKSTVKTEVSGEVLPDLTKTDLRGWYLVPHPEKEKEYRRLKERTPARIGLWRTGARYLTDTMLRMRADHAAAQDSVFSMVREEFPKEMGWHEVTTLCKDKDTYLTRPDLGRRFGEEAQREIKKVLGNAPKVALVVGDGLSSAAIEANAADCMQAILQGLQVRNISASPVVFVKYCRVGASDHIGSLTDAELVCMLVGERPGLVTAESMSCYITYGARIGVPESQRTVISNIHRGGTPAVEAGAHIAELIETMLQKKASGVRLKALMAGGGAL